MGRSHARHSSHALLQARGSPRDIQVHDNFGVLKIHTFAQQVCRQKKVDLLRGARRWCIVRSGRKAGKCLIARESSPGDARSVSGEQCNATKSLELPKQYRDCLSVLSECDDLCFWMRSANARDYVSALAVERRSRRV